MALRQIGPPQSALRAKNRVRQFTPNLEFDVGPWRNDEWRTPHLEGALAASGAWIVGENVWLRYSVGWSDEKAWLALNADEIIELARESHDPELLIIASRVERTAA